MSFRDSRRRASVAALLLAAACGGAAPRHGGSDAPRGGTAVVAVPADFRSLDPVIGSRDSEGQLMAYALFAPLVRYDSALVPRPWLAARWDTAPAPGDSLDLTFHLRGDVRWHDGPPTTARDVAFAWRRMQDPRTAYPHRNLLRGYSPAVRVLDDSTVRFRLRPFPEYLEVWSRIGGLPEHLLRGVAPEAEGQDAYGRAPVGNGPFRFAGRVPGESFTLEANRTFPAALGGPPRVARLVHRVIPEPTTALSELAAGNADLLAGIPEALASRLSAIAGAHVVTYRTPTWVYLAWNTRRAPFSDARVRRALTRAIDREALVRGLFHGHAIAGRATVTPVHWAFDASDSASALAYDPQRAMRELDEGGWRLRDGAAVRSDAAGHRLQFVIKCPSHSPWCEAAQVVQADLRRVGVQAEVREEELNTLIAEMGGRAAAGRDYDAAVMNNTDYISKTDVANFGSAEQAGPYAETGYHSEALDSLFEALDRTADHDRARPLWLRYQREMAQAAPVTVLYYPERLAAVGPRVSGVRMDARGFYVSIAEWSVTGSRR